VTLVPDRREDGTTVIALPSDCGFVFSYGPGSFGRHQAEAQRLGLPTRVERSPSLSWDVDLPDDLRALSPSPGATGD
jgi:2-phospho-L-lactate guanylyltransferase